MLEEGANALQCEALTAHDDGHGEGRRQNLRLEDDGHEEAEEDDGNGNIAMEEDKKKRLRFQWIR